MIHPTYNNRSEFVFTFPKTLRCTLKAKFSSTSCKTFSYTRLSHSTRECIIYWRARLYNNRAVSINLIDICFSCHIIKSFRFWIGNSTIISNPRHRIIPFSAEISNLYAFVMLILFLIDKYFTGVSIIGANKWMLAGLLAVCFNHN